MKTEKVVLASIVLVTIGLLFVLGTPYLFNDPDPNTEAAPPAQTCPGNESFIAISSIAELKQILRDRNYRLCAELDLSQEEWQPIPVFEGQLDGNGFSIRGLSRRKFAEGIYQPPGGLFGALQNAGVKNLRLIEASIKAAGSSGVLAASANNSTIENVSVDGELECSDNCGLIVGTSISSIFNRVATHGRVSSKQIAGGVAGLSQDGNFADVSVDTTKFNIHADLVGGGIVGVFSGGDLLRSSFIGRVEGAKSVGGLVGEINRFENPDSITQGANLEQSVASGETVLLDSSGAVGGLVGHISGAVDDSVTLRDSRDETTQHCVDSNCGNFVGNSDGVAVKEEHLYRSGTPADLNTLSAQGFDITLLDDPRPSVWKAQSADSPKLYWEVDQKQSEPSIPVGEVPVFPTIGDQPPISPPQLAQPSDPRVTPTVHPKKPKLEHKKKHKAPKPRHKRR